MGGLFGGAPKVTIPTQRTIVPPPSKAEPEALANASRAAILRARAAYGQSDTMLTSDDLGKAPVKKKTLLGE